MENPRSLSDVLIKQAGMYPDKIAYSFLDSKGELFQQISYNDLLKMARSIASYIDKIASDANAAILLFPAGLDYIKAFFASGMAGKTAIPLSLPHSLENNHAFGTLLKSISEQSSSRLIITNNIIKSSLENLLPDFIIISLEHEDITETEFRKEHTGPACYLFTSGSTSTPKGVVISHSNLVHNGIAFTNSYNYSENSVTVSWLPHFHAFGMLVNIIYPLFSGSTSIIYSPSDFAADPLKWAERLSEFHATHTGSPNFGFEIAAIEAEKRNPVLDLSSLSVAFCAGEPVKYSTYNRFFNVFKEQNLRSDFFKPMYGMSEAGTITAKDLGEPSFIHLDLHQLHEHKILETEVKENIKTIVGCGSPISEVEIVVLNSELHHVPSDEIGEIWISSPSLFDRYLDENNKDSVFTYINEKRFFKTGDLGFLKNGELFITGRIKEVIIINGKNHYPADIETSIALSDSLLTDIRKVVFSVQDALNEEKIIAIVEAPSEGSDFNLLFKKAATKVLSSNGVRLSELIFVQRGSIPSTGSGKLQRKACKNNYLSNNLLIISHANYSSEAIDTNTPANENAVIVRLKEFLKEIININTTGDSANFSIYELGSIELIRLARKISDYYNIVVQVSDIVSSENLKGLSDLLLKKVNETERQESVVESEESTIQSTIGLSINQRGLLIDYTRDHHTFRYNTPLAFQLYNATNISSLVKAVDKVQERHPILRGRVTEINGKPVFTISEKRVPLKININAGDKDLIIEQIQKKAWKSFIPNETEPLFYAELLLGDNEEKFLFINASHLLLDGMSCQLLIKEITSLYERIEQNTDEKENVKELHFLNYPDWEMNYLSHIDKVSIKQFWTSKENIFQGLNLPYDHYSSPVASPGISCFTLSDDIFTNANNIAKELKVSRYALFLSAYFVLLYKYTRQHTITIGTAFLNRPQEIFENSLGYYSNIQPVHSGIDINASFKEFASSIYSEINKLISFQSFPYPELVRILREAGVDNDALSFQTFFLYQDWLTDFNENTLFQEQIFEINQAAVGDLTFELLKTRDSIKVLIKYNAEKFQKSTIEFIADNYSDILNSIIASPEKKIQGFVELTSKEKNILSEWNNTAKELPDIKNLYTLFEERFRSHPDKLAIITENSRLTYKDLYHKIQCLSQSLHNKGIKKGSKVAILLQRSENIPLAFLSLLQLGAIYIPLDPALPESRLNYILEHAAPDIILTTSSSLKINLEEFNRLDLSQLDMHSNGLSLPVESYDPKNTVYLIYTSGSTGKPKGVEVVYEGLVNFYHSMIETPGIDENDLLLAISTISFDIAFTEIVVPLLTGATIYVATEDEQKSGEDLRRIIESYKITVLQGTPTTFKLLLKSGWDDSTCLKKALSTGEALPQEVARHILSTRTELWDMYGPTEATIEATISKITDAKDISIGKPLNNTRLYVLDEFHHQVPIGAQGELYLAGTCLAKGYLHQPELTAERFIKITDQPIPEQVIYKTGDIVRFATNGLLYYYGRNDHQVKIRGYRIELEEIEHVFKSIPGISDCCVSAEKSDAGNIELKACIIPVSEKDHHDLREYQDRLKKILPAYMVPSSIYKRKDLPLLPNGKIDRKILFTNGEYLTIISEKRDEVNETEKHVLEIWKTILGRSPSGIDRAFFDEGGSSLLIPELQSIFMQNFPEVRIRLVDFFKYTTIKTQASWIEKERLNSIKKLPKEDVQSVFGIYEPVEIAETKSRKDLRIHFRTLIS